MVAKTLAVNYLTTTFYIGYMITNSVTKLVVESLITLILRRPI